MLPQPGLDAAWQTGLHLATHNALRFGKDIVFTYGPYGFLSVPSFVSAWTGYASILYAFVVVLSFAITVVHFARRSFTLLGGIALAYGVLWLTYFDAAEVAVVVFFLWCLGMLTRDAEDAVPKSFPAWGGALAALQLLIKFDAGITMIALVALTVWGARRERLKEELLAAVSFIGSFLVLWVAARQPLGGIPAYLHRSLQVASGYSSAMSREASQRIVEYLAVAIVVAVLLPLIVARARRGSRVIVFLLLAAMIYTEFLHGFIRHDWYHSAPYMVFAAVLPIAVPWRGGLRFVALACCAFFIWVAWLIPTPTNSLPRDTKERPHEAFTQLRMVIDPPYRHEQITAARRDLRASLNIDPATVALLQGNTVAVDAYDISAVWAYHLDWRPFPVFQTYSAYNTPLDQMNADFLASSAAPQRILRRGPPFAIDHRYPFFESPAYQLALVCDYAPLRQTKAWEVLGKVANRCGVPSPIGSVRAAAGQAIAIPRPEADAMIVARFDVKASLFGRLLDKLFKPKGAPAVVLDGKSYRFIAADAEQPHVLCMPPSLGAREYGGGVCPLKIALTGAGPVTIRFYAIKLS